MASQKITLQVGEGLSTEELLEALAEHKSEIKGLLLANLEYVDSRATCDGFHLDSVVFERGRHILRYHYDWSAYYGCKDANNGDTEYDETSLEYVSGQVTIEHEVRPQRFPNEEF